MNKDEALNIIQEDGLELKNLPDHFKKDKEIALKAVKQNGYSLEYIDDSLKKDKEVVLKAVKKNVFSLQVFLVASGQATFSQACRNHHPNFSEMWNSNRSGFESRFKISSRC